jgi:futalosine hydrolase
LFVPTEIEIALLDELGGFDAGTCIVKRCGFGPVASAAVAATVLASLRPARALLVGIAGTYDTDVAPLGSALEFDEVAIDGIGAGASARFLGPAALGFAQWNGAPSESGAARIFDRITLRERDRAEHGGRLLVSVCAVADTRAMAEERRQRFPDARAEDMEGFGVALACELASVPLRIVRGISNVAGDRDRWRVREALAAARELARSIASEPLAEDAR